MAISDRCESCPKWKTLHQGLMSIVVNFVEIYNKVNGNKDCET